MPPNTSNTSACFFQQPLNKYAHKTESKGAFQHVILIVQLDLQEPGGGKAALLSVIQMPVLLFKFLFSTAYTSQNKSFSLCLQGNTFPFHFYCIYGTFKF